MSPQFVFDLDGAAARLLHASWQAGVLALLVLAISLIGGRRLDPRFRFVLWLVVFARLAMPVVPTASWSMFGWFSQGPWQMTALDNSPKSTVALPQPADKPAAIPATRSPGSPAAIDPADAPSAADVGSARWSISFRGIAVAVWLLGAAVLVVRLLLAGAWLRSARRGWIAASDPALVAMFEQCRRELGIGPAVALWISPDRLGPATLGCFRPAVVVPRQLAQSLPAAELRLILLHELIHVRRRDVPIDRLACLLTAIHWPNPLAWLALVGLRRSRESACDAALLDRVGTATARDYGRLILSTIEMLAEGGFRPAAVGIFGRSLGASLRGRIRSIAGYRKPGRGLAAVATGLVLLVALVGLTDAKTPGVAERDRLLAERVATAKYELMVVRAAFEAETVTLDLVFEAAEKLAVAEAAMLNTPEAMIAVRQRHLERARQTEAKIEALFNVGARGGEAEKYAAAKLVRQSAEIALIRQQLGLPPEPDPER